MAMCFQLGVFRPMKLAACACTEPPILLDHDRGYRHS
jgi:hypothetical protein